MTTFIELYQHPTPTNFSKAGYLLANEDVKNAGADPWDHFQNFGLLERRTQINPEILNRGSSYRLNKHKRFRSLINSNIKTPRSFPAVLTKTQLNLDDYLFESANVGFGPFIDEIESNPRKNYLDLGCGLRPRVYSNCLYLEVYPSITADVIVDSSCQYPFHDESFDGIGCFAVLEHTKMPWKVADEIMRMLKPGGKVFIDWPFLQPVHGFPSHYFNATREGLFSLFSEDYTVETCVSFPNQTPDHTINWVLGKLIGSISNKDLMNEVLGMTLADLLSNPPGSDLWRRILSSLSDEQLSEFACGNSLIAQKVSRNE